MINDEYVDRIIYVIEGSTLVKKELKDDLVDHFCCLVEMDMNRGMGFDDAFKKAYDQTCPNGLDEIQKETVFLLNYNRILFMKRLMYLIGLMGSITFSAGLGLRILQWPIGSDMMLIGLIVLGFLFLPMILIDKYKHLGSQATLEKVKWFFGILCGVTFATGGIFKILHYPGASILLALSFLFFCLGFLPILFFRMYKKSVEEL
jgi:hypothetical protein